MTWYFQNTVNYSIDSKNSLEKLWKKRQKIHSKTIRWSAAKPTELLKIPDRFPQIAHASVALKKDEVVCGVDWILLKTPTPCGVVIFYRSSLGYVYPRNWHTLPKIAKYTNDKCGKTLGTYLARTIGSVLCLADSIVDVNDLEFAEVVMTERARIFVRNRIWVFVQLRYKSKRPLVWKKEVQLNNVLTHSKGTVTFTK